jgi:hypothetical protein
MDMRISSGPLEDGAVGMFWGVLVENHQGREGWWCLILVDHIVTHRSVKYIEIWWFEAPILPILPVIHQIGHHFIITIIEDGVERGSPSCHLVYTPHYLQFYPQETTVDQKKCASTIVNVAFSRGLHLLGLIPRWYPYSLGKFLAA